MLRGWIFQDRSKIKATTYIYQKLLMKKLPEVYQNLFKNEIYPTFYAVNWFLTLFWYRLDESCAVKTFDKIFMEGYIALFKMALTIMSILSPKLIDASFEEALRLLTSNLEYVNPLIL